MYRRKHFSRAQLTKERRQWRIKCIPRWKAPTRSSGWEASGKKKIIIGRRLSDQGA